MLGRSENQRDVTKGRLGECLRGISDYAAKAGIQIAADSPSGWEIFRSFPPVKQLVILDNVTKYAAILQRGIDMERDPLDLNADEEIDLVRFALDEWKMELVDNFTQFIRQNDIIEVYSREGIQLYRNFEFFKKCSYSLLDLITQEWFTLYERASSVTKAIFDSTNEVMTGAVSTVQYRVPVHTLQERYLDAHNVFQMKMKYLSPLRRRGSLETVGFIHSLTADPISLPKDGSRLSFL